MMSYLFSAQYMYVDFIVLCFNIITHFSFPIVFPQDLIHVHTTDKRAFFCLLFQGFVQCVLVMLNVLTVAVIRMIITSQGSALCQICSNSGHEHSSMERSLTSDIFSVPDVCLLSLTMGHCSGMPGIWGSTFLLYSCFFTMTNKDICRQN